MTQYLPPNLLALFAPRDPIPYLPPVDKPPHAKRTRGYTGIADFVQEFEDPADAPPPVVLETREERQERKRRAKAEQVAYKLEQDIALWHPEENPNATTDPFKTLFVARVNYDTSESKLRREFEIYGPIHRVVMVHDNNTGKPRGYAFIEYERTRDMVSAYKHADGKKIDGRRVLVDYEKGRTVKGWLPRRLGGGLGGTRRGGSEVNVKHSGREESRQEDRYMDRHILERERKSRSRSRERRRRNRSRSRERRRAERQKHDRSRDHDRTRDREPASERGEPGLDAGGEAAPDAEPSREKRRRSRSRDRDRKRRRSRSRDRKRRERGESRKDREEKNKEEPQIQIKEEPNTDDYNNSGYEGDFNNYNNNSMETSNYEGY